MSHLSPPEDQISLLEELIPQAFKRALSEERSEAAEHLLRALEALEPNATPGSSVARAYLAISDRTINDSLGPRRLR
jgi:hypothetical protein